MAQRGSTDPHAGGPAGRGRRAAALPRWRSLLPEEEVCRLAAQYARAERDRARARASVERLSAVCLPVAVEIARTYAPGEADVADLVQETMLVLSRDLPQLRRPEAFPSWFARVAHNVGKQWLRRERVRHRTRSLDAPPRPGWLGASEGAQPADVPDPDAARAFVDFEARDQVRRLLRLLPAPQRVALVSAYLGGRSHEEIGRDLGVSPRAAEGLVYRALRRLQTVAAQCTAEPREIGVWCPRCGRCRLVAQLLPGVAPDGPLWRRWRCPGCGLASHWTEPNLVSLTRYPSVEHAWWHEREQWGGDVRALARAAGPRCWKCGAPVLRRDRPAADEGDTGAGAPPLYALHWSCFRCDVGTFWGYLPVVATGLVPEWLAFWRAAPRLIFEPERLRRSGREAQVVLAAGDRDTGRRATLVLARDTLEVRRLDVAGA